MTREVQHHYPSCTELDGELQNEKGDYISLTAVIVKAYETRKQGDYYKRNIYVADTPDAKGKFRITLSGKEEKYLNIIEGRMYVFKGTLDVNDSGALSMWGAFATRVEAGSPSATGEPYRSESNNAITYQHTITDYSIARQVAFKALAPLVGGHFDNPVEVMRYINNQNVAHWLLTGELSDDPFKE